METTRDGNTLTIMLDDTLVAAFRQRLQSWRIKPVCCKSDDCGTMLTFGENDERIALALAEGLADGFAIGLSVPRD